MNAALVSKGTVADEGLPLEMLQVGNLGYKTGDSF
jgi:hypothetical protein